MKKIWLLLIILSLVALVGCSVPTNDLPPLDDGNKVEMSLEEKVVFLQSVSMDEMDASNFKFQQFAKVDFAYSAELEQSVAGVDAHYEMDGLVNLDIDQVSFISLGSSHEDSFIYIGLDKAYFHMDINNHETFAGETSSENVDDIDATINFNGSYAYLNSDGMYFNLDGSAVMNQLTQEGELVIDSKSVNETYDAIQERVISQTFDEALYLEIESMLNEMRTMLQTDLSLDEMTEMDEEMVDFIDEMVSVYSGGTTHTIRIHLTKEMINEMIDLVFESYTDIGSMDLQQLLEIKDTVKNALQSFDLDFRIEVVGEALGTKTLSKILFNISGKFQGFSLDMSEMGEDVMPVVLQFGIDIQRFGFIIDLDADLIELPTNDELETFEVVEVPSFAEIFENMNM
ncbi:Uncharacterised protein [Acholeplasma oculi]|uniref:Lipoprotein n=1 Tax=Acholeplasma oculi TaxID=35623 RepID=A0A061AH93_9MOLU|nr:hypothetical protein [Acholeplasma oculi]CDR30337.1 hypothetical protein Aocu_02640 [Acholeplasma oculi]SKC42557.1 hypothetical protein SAMN02745122_0907 [Acholeplasma oculi]SUT88826.1 Uncharacterised protein [Acholeplasma oculi]